MWWCANQPAVTAETNSTTSPDHQPSGPSLYSSWVAGGDGGYQHLPSWFSSPDAATSFPGAGSATDLIPSRDRIADGDENVNGGGMIEVMFEKPLTPSDVGKLNRLVIPKQHAEKHFPLGDGNSVEKGMLLSFEDDSGKQWRFRYSYWNSSQSYVFTKGWSRFVKEKRLDAGDVVLFQRHRRHCDRLFIGWRRRPAALPVALLAHDSRAAAEPAAGWTSGGGFYSAHPSPHHLFHHHHHHHHQVVSYHHHEVAVANPDHCPYGEEQEVAAAVGRSSSSNSNSNSMLRRVRLFGVNLECLQQPEPDEDELRLEPSSSDLGGSSSFMCNNHDPPHSLFQPQAYSSSIHHPGHMDVNFRRDVNQR